jgi:hypothetical protein
MSSTATATAPRSVRRRLRFGAGVASAIVDRPGASDASEVSSGQSVGAGGSSVARRLRRIRALRHRPARRAVLARFEGLVVAGRLVDVGHGSLPSAAAPRPRHRATPVTAVSVDNGQKGYGRA